MKDGGESDAVETALWRERLEKRVEELEKELKARKDFDTLIKSYALKATLGVVTFLAIFWARAKGLL